MYTTSRAGRKLVRRQWWKLSFLHRPVLFSGGFCYALPEGDFAFLRIRVNPKRIAGGEFAGKCIYVAEHIGSILPVGTSFDAGATLATAYPGPDWTEWGWAKALDTPTVTWAECGCTEQDNVNPGGRAFARFLRSLGATTEQDPGPGPMYAGGSC